MRQRKRYAAAAIGGVAGLAVGVGGFAAAADATPSTKPTHEHGTAQRSRTDVVANVSWPSNCLNHSSSPTHVGSDAVASAIASCTTKKRFKVFTHLSKDRWFGWSPLGSNSHYVASGYYDIASVRNYCKGAGTYTYRNSYALYVAPPKSPTKVASKYGSPQARFTC